MLRTGLFALLLLGVSSASVASDRLRVIVGYDSGYLHVDYGGHYHGHRHWKGHHHHHYRPHGHHYRPGWLFFDHRPHRYDRYHRGHDHHHGRGHRHHDRRWHRH